MDDNQELKQEGPREEFLRLLDEFLRKYPDYKNLLDQIEKRPKLFAQLERRNKNAFEDFILLLNRIKIEINYIPQISLFSFETLIGHFNGINDLFNRLNDILHLSDDEIINSGRFSYPEIINQCTFVQEEAKKFK